MDLLFIFAIIPLIIELVLLLLFLIKFDISVLIPLTRSFRYLTQKAEMISDCKKENINKLAKSLQDPVSDRVSERYKHMKSEIEHRYQGAFVPTFADFFQKNELIDAPSGRSLIRPLALLSGLFLLLTLTMPSAISLLFQIETTSLAMAYSLIVISIITVLCALFIWIDQRLYHRTIKCYGELEQQYNRIVPVADRNTTLVTEMILQNQKSFERGVTSIVSGFDEFTDGKVLPALNESIRKIAEAQEKGMDQLAKEFTDQLVKTLDVSLTDVSETISGIQVDMIGLRNSLNENIGSLSELLITQREVLKESSDKLTIAQKQQLKSMAHVERLLMHSIETGETLAIQTNKMSETVYSFSDANEQLRGYISELMNNVIAIQADVSEKMQKGQENLHASIQQSGDLIDNITQKMKDAMAAAGEEIASGIREVTGDNAEAIAMITEQSRMLREDFDEFFTRIEEHTNATYDDMDYHMQNVISKLSTEADRVLKDNSEINQETLKSYQEVTSNLLQEFKDQANSISLYAKEINMDINDLSENLQNAVGLFKDSLSESVDLTMHEFDSGLAELSLRIANTVQSILDAVEKIPEIVDK